MSESVVNLIKQAQQAGEPLFKGDVVGHEFHGNQHTGSSGKKTPEERAHEVAVRALFPKASEEEQAQLHQAAMRTPMDKPWHVQERLQSAKNAVERKFKEATPANVIRELKGV